MLQWVFCSLIGCIPTLWNAITHHITLRACLHGGAGPQVGEVTRLGGVTRLYIQSLILMWSRLHVRWGNLPHVTSPTWGPPPSCKQALKEAWSHQNITVLITVQQFVLTGWYFLPRGPFSFCPFWSNRVRTLFEQKIPGLFKDFQGHISHFSRTPFNAKKSLEYVSFLVLPQHEQFYPEGLSVFAPFSYLRIWVG